MKNSTKTEHETRENQNLASRKQRVHREGKQGESLGEVVGKNHDSLAAGLMQPARLEQKAITQGYQATYFDQFEVYTSCRGNENKTKKQKSPKQL